MTSSSISKKTFGIFLPKISWNTLRLHSTKPPMQVEAPPPPETFDNINDMIVWENAVLRKALEREQKENEGIRKEIALLRVTLIEKSSKLLDMQQELTSYKNTYTAKQMMLEESMLHVISVNKTPLIWLKKNITQKHP